MASYVSRPSPRGLPHEATGTSNMSSMFSFIADAAFVCISGSVFKACMKASLLAITSGSSECNRSLKSTEALLV